MLLIVRFFIRAYQVTISPVLSWLGGPGSGCRFQPTCSHYFLEAVRDARSAARKLAGLEAFGALPAVGWAGT